MPRPRLSARRVQLGSLSLLLAGASLAACGSGSSGPSAFTLVSKAFKDAAASTWVHEVRHATESGQVLVTDDYVGTTSGSEHIELSGSIASVIVLPAAAYFRGNTKAMTTFFKFKNPRKLAGKWIAVKSTESGYLSLSDPVTIKSDLGSYSILGPLTEASKTTLSGQSVLPINGFVAGPNKTEIVATLYVTTTGTVLPVEFSVMTSKIKSTTAWSGWGHAIVLTAPATSIPVKVAAKG